MVAVPEHIYRRRIALPASGIINGGLRSSQTRMRLERGPVGQSAERTMLMTYWDGNRWRSDEPEAAPARGRPWRRLFGATSEALLVTMLIFGLIAGTTFAAKGGGGKGAGAAGGGDKGSLSLVMLEDANADGLPNYGESLTFDVATTATDKPYVNVRCYQGTSFVYDGWAGFFPGAWFGTTFTMSSATWVTGDADCTARLVMWGNNGRERTLAEQAFRVSP
jgi:hypothetical protein